MEGKRESYREGGGRGHRHVPHAGFGNKQRQENPVFSAAFGRNGALPTHLVSDLWSGKLRRWC